MVGNLVLAVVLVRDERFRPLLVVVVAFLLPVVRIVVELSGLDFWNWWWNSGGRGPHS